YTFQASDKGVHNFADVALNTPDSQSIAATDIQNGSISSSKTAITFEPAILFRKKNSSVKDSLRWKPLRLFLVFPY
ncbi:MAG TPA: hypothetical protein VJY36_07570, partial [Candidatus Bathyarchaeia archaeon]|nr:hypothetical protein [Candidatus Bathyarchaeia archaeon]